MSAETLLSSPWKEFLTEIDEALNESLDLHCIDGFVVAHFYGLPRATGDIDYYTAVPANINLIEAAGEGSKLHKKYGVCLQGQRGDPAIGVRVAINRDGQGPVHAPEIACAGSV